MTRAITRPGIDPAEVYQALGPVTSAERRMLAKLPPRLRTRWFSNIYGPATAAYAQAEYRRGAR